MAKELPYYKHEPSEWLEGEIQVCSDAAIVCFSNLRDGYWLKLGCMTYAFALQKYCRRDPKVIQELIDNGIIDLEGDQIRIKFLDLQLREVNLVSEKRSKAAQKRWNNTNAMQVHSKSNAIRKEEIRRDKIKEDNILLEKETKYNFSNELKKYGFDPSLISDWLKVRKAKKATNTETAFKAFIREIEKTKIDKNEILKICTERSWSGFKSEWLQNINLNQKNNAANQPITKDDRIDGYIARVLDRNRKQNDGPEHGANNENSSDGFSSFEIMP